MEHKILYQKIKSTFWSIDNFPCSAKEEIRNGIFWLKVYILYSCLHACLVLALLNIINPPFVISWPFMGDSQFIYILFCSLFMLFCIGCYVISFTHGFLFFYYSTHAIVQMKILTVYLKGTSDLVSKGGRTYQQEVYRVLITCINQYTNMKR